MFQCFSTPLAHAWWVGNAGNVHCKYVLQTTPDNPLNRQTSFYFPSHYELQCARCGWWISNPITLSSWVMMGSLTSGSSTVSKHWKVMGKMSVRVCALSGIPNKINPKVYRANFQKWIRALRKATLLNYKEYTIGAFKRGGLGMNKRSLEY